MLPVRVAMHGRNQTILRERRSHNARANPTIRCDRPELRNGLASLSLNALRAFEATARLQRFNAAGDELSLGLPLLIRSAHGTKPMEEGQRLAEGLRGLST